MSLKVIKAAAGGLAVGYILGSFTPWSWNPASVKLAGGLTLAYLLGLFKPKDPKLKEEEAAAQGDGVVPSCKMCWKMLAATWVAYGVYQLTRQRGGEPGSDGCEDPECDGCGEPGSDGCGEPESDGCGEPASSVEML